MANIIRKTTDFAMHIISSYAFKGCVVVDATCGNGNDTLTLLKREPSKLYAFDIQQPAINSTRALLEANGYNKLIENGTVSIICDSHANISKYINENVDIIVFNLGYLPGGNKSITTTRSETITAVESSLKLLSKDGLMCITMYSGHLEGVSEKKELLDFSKKLDSSIYHCAYLNFTNQNSAPPEILMITKKK